MASVKSSVTNVLVDIASNEWKKKHLSVYTFCVIYGQNKFIQESVLCTFLINILFHVGKLLHDMDNIEYQNHSLSNRKRQEYVFVIIIIWYMKIR